MWYDIKIVRFMGAMREKSLFGFCVKTIWVNLNISKDVKCDVQYTQKKTNV